MTYSLMEPPGNIYPVPIHVTDRKIFKECRKKYDYKVIQRLAPDYGTEDYFHTGTIGHHALATWYKSNGQEMELLSDDLDDSTYQMLLGVLDNYRATYSKDFEHFEILGVEENFKVWIWLEEFKLWVELTGTVDLRVRYRGYTWIVDHKFLANLVEEDSLEMDDQMTTYLWLLDKHQIPWAGALYNVIRKKAPAPPKRLVSGLYSCDKTQLTTPELFRVTVNAAGQKVKTNPKYLEYYKHLQNRPNPFLQRHFVSRTHDELIYFEQELLEELKDMVRVKIYYRNTSRDCTRCMFNKLCKAQAEGVNWQSILEHYYTTRPEGVR